MSGEHLAQFTVGASPMSTGSNRLKVASLLAALNQADQFDWITNFLRKRGYLRSAQLIMGVAASSAALVPLSLVVVGRGQFRWLVFGAALSAYSVGMTVFWLTRWPTRWQSEVAILIGVLCTAGWSVSQSSPAEGALGCTALAVTGGYIAFFHSSRILLLNIALAVGIGAFQVLRMSRETDIATATAAFWIIWFLNLTVPVAIRGMTRAMGVYAVRSEEDPLTGLLNRRGFIDVITRQLARPPTTNAHFTLLMVDLDNFKRINDSHGHAAGDRILVSVAETLRQHTPPTATICRAGGEEFLIALTSPTTDQSHISAGLCSAIAALPHRITASIGAATADLRTLGHPETSVCIEQLVATADMAMYLAKRNGGNHALHV